MIFTMSADAVFYSRFGARDPILSHLLLKGVCCQTPIEFGLLLHTTLQELFTDHRIISSHEV